jgi:hypothetical protein
MDEQFQPPPSRNDPWPLVRDAAQRVFTTREIYESNERHHRYQISKVEPDRIVIDRLIGEAGPETLSSREVRTAMVRFKDNFFSLRRGKLFQIVAKEVTLVYLHPEICWSKDYTTIELIGTSMIYPDEIEDSRIYREGTLKSAYVNIYERHSAARAKCIAHYGTKCQVCGMSFTERYGSIGKGFIHVHHIKRLSDIGKEYEVDPVTDLRPVCPNCHSMLHRSEPPLSITELMNHLRKSQL